MTAGGREFQVAGAAQLAVVVVIKLTRNIATFVVGMLISFFFPKIDYRFEKIDFFSIIEFWCRYLAMPWAIIM